MNDKVSDGIKEIVGEALDEYVITISCNLRNVFAGLLYTLKLENEKLNCAVGDIEKLIQTVIRTSYLKGPEGEQYPAYNEKIVGPYIERLAKLLRNHGINQSWNLSSTTRLFGIQREDSLKKQLKDVKQMATNMGCYDAADAIDKLLGKDK